MKDFRNYCEAEIAIASDGITVVEGGNGQGKTNLIEALSYLATMRSFRGAPSEALVRDGATRAFLRAEVDSESREVLIEAELARGGRDRMQINRQALRRTRDLVSVLRVSVFSPDDLVLVKGGPGERRRFLDETLVSLYPRLDALRSEVDQVLRQRNALLRQAGGRLSTSAAATLDVWDAQLATVGTALADQREALVGRLGPKVAEAYQQLSHDGIGPEMTYRRSWLDKLGEALLSARSDDLRRAMTTVGPQRDELELSLGELRLPARTHASQGEQRSLCLAMRLGAHNLVIEQTREVPVLLLDDVFSELDEWRCSALLRVLPLGQCLLSTAGRTPAGAAPVAVLRVEAGRFVDEAGTSDDEPDTSRASRSELGPGGSSLGDESRSEAPSDSTAKLG